jgi:hypothetical protein
VWGVGRTVLQCRTTGLHCMRGTFPDFAGEEAFAVVVVVGFLFFFLGAKLFRDRPNCWSPTLGFCNPKLSVPPPTKAVALCFLIVQPDAFLMQKSALASTVHVLYGFTQF